MLPILMSFIPYILVNRKYTIVDVPEHLARQYLGDWFGLMRELKINDRWSPFILLINNFSSSYEWNQRSFILPNEAELNAIVASFPELTTDDRVIY